MSTWSIPADGFVSLEVQVMFNLRPLTTRHLIAFDARPGVGIPEAYVAPYSCHPFPSNLAVRLNLTKPKVSEYIEGWHLIRASLQIEGDMIGYDRAGLVCLGIESAVPSCLIPFPSEVPEWRGMFTVALRRVGP